MGYRDRTLHIPTYGVLQKPRGGNTTKLNPTRTHAKGRHDTTEHSKKRRRTYPRRARNHHEVRGSEASGADKAGDQRLLELVGLHPQKFRRPLEAGAFALSADLSGAEPNGAQTSSFYSYFLVPVPGRKGKKKHLLPHLSVVGPVHFRRYIHSHYLSPRHIVSPKPTTSTVCCGLRVRSRRGN